MGEAKPESTEHSRHARDVENSWSSSILVKKQARHRSRTETSLQAEEEEDLKEPVPFPRVTLQCPGVLPAVTVTSHTEKQKAKEV